jgi:hypothetical protein
VWVNSSTSATHSSTVIMEYVRRPLKTTTSIETSLGEREASVEVRCENMVVRGREGLRRGGSWVGDATVVSERVVMQYFTASAVLEINN